MPTFSMLTTVGGFTCGEVASALQKAIRRGEERDAMFWASELDLTGYGNYAWKRLRLIASEDVGLADPEAVLLVRVLFENWLEQRKADKSNGAGVGSAPLFLLHATMVLARASKSRIVDSAYMVFYEGTREGFEIPDHALDKHTARGRKMGRGVAHFFEESVKLANAAKLADPYLEEGMVAREQPVRREYP